jgi:hypothetical protein
MRRGRREEPAIIQKWEKDLGLTPQPPETPGEAMIQAEIRSHLAKMKPTERMSFIDAHASEVTAAVLTRRASSAA